MPLLLLSLLLLLAGCDGNPVLPDPDPDPDPVTAYTGIRWVSSLRGDASSLFKRIASDSAGNVLVAGTINDGKSFIRDAMADEPRVMDGDNYLLVKYSPEGRILWSRVGSSSGGSTFESVAVDQDDNVYVVGAAAGLCELQFPGADPIVVPLYDMKPCIAKYSPDGTLLWVRTISGGSMSSLFTDVFVTAAGEVFVSGYIRGYGTYVLDEDTSVECVNSWKQALLVKYDAQGRADWARTVKTTAMHSLFSTLAVDSAGAIHVAGYLSGSGVCTFAEGFSSTLDLFHGSYMLSAVYDMTGSVRSVFPVRLDASCDSQRCSRYVDMCVHGEGAVAQAGAMQGNFAYPVGESSTVAGDSQLQNGLLSLFGSSGGYAGGTGGGFGSNAESAFFGVASAASGTLYGAGQLDPFWSLSDPVENIFGILAKADRTGKPVALDVFSAGEDIGFSSVCVDKDGQILVAGNYTMGYLGSFVMKLSDKTESGGKSLYPAGWSVRGVSRIDR